MDLFRQGSARFSRLSLLILMADYASLGELAPKLCQSLIVWPHWLGELTKRLVFFSSLDAFVFVKSIGSPLGSLYIESPRMCILHLFLMDGNG